MSYLLDTNVISELARSVPNRNVVSWFESIPNESLYLSVLSLGEVRRGVEALPRSQNARKEKLRLWLEHDIRRWFDTRILAVDAAVADRWGRLLADAGKPVASIDSLIAATALQHDLRLVTRNLKDFDFPGLHLIDPWVEQ